MAQQSVLITGCSAGGIGDSLAQAFHKKGVRVFATARNLDKVQHLKDAGIEVIQLDVVDDASIKAAFETVKALTGGTLNILVNNSGGGYTMPLLDADISTAKMFDVNVFALVAVTQAFMPLLAASKGTVINIGSVLGYAPWPWSGYYNASKAAVNILTDQLRLELSPWNIKCILVVAGATRTKFLQNLPEPPKLPAGSLYIPARDRVETSMAGAELARGAMDVTLFADRVVANALKPNPKKHLWLGGGSSDVWRFHTFGWSTIWDTIIPGMLGLPEIATRINASSTPVAK